MDSTLAHRFPLRLLLADDNLINQKVGTSVLQKLGYRADLANNGLEVLAALEQKAYDVVLMDVQMPEMDGFEATRAIVERWPESKRPRIIAMTGNALLGDREKCLAAGMDDYLSKPIRPGDIRGIIEKWGLPGNSTEEKKLPLAPKVETPDGPPVEMDRLNDLTDNNADSLREVVEMYFKQTSAQFEQIKTALRTGHADEVRRVAHSCAGASATLGMMQLGQLMRDLEKEGAAGALTNATKICEDAVREYSSVKKFLAIQPGLAVTMAAVL